MASLVISRENVRIQGSLIPIIRKAPINQQQGQAQNKNNNQNAQKGKDERKTGRVFYIQAGEIPEGEPVMMGMFHVANHPALYFLIRVHLIHSSIEHLW